MRNYSYQGEKSEKSVRVFGSNLPISFKNSYEVAAAIRGKDVNKAIAHLKDAVATKRPIPFNRFVGDVGHKRGKMAAGRYPRNASLQVVNLLNTLKKNAEDKNLNAEKLKIIHSVAQKGSNVRRSGRVRGLRKITHFEIIAEEMSEKKPKEKKK